MRTFRIIKTLTMGYAWLVSLLAIVSSLSVVVASISSPSKYTNVVTPLNASCHRILDCTSDRYPTYLNCVKGRCTCDSHTFYDDYDGICRVRYPSQCLIKRSPSELVQPCVRFAHCAFPLDQSGNELKSALHGTCQCLVNRFPNPDGTCSGSTPTLLPVYNPVTAILFTCAIFMASSFRLR